MRGNNGKLCGRRTAQYRAVGCQKSVLKRLFYIPFLESLLLRNDLVQVLASVYCNLVAAMAVVYAEEAQSLVRRCRLALLAEGLQVKDTGVGVLHADSPPLHRGHAEDEVLAIAAL